MELKDALAEFEQIEQVRVARRKRRGIDYYVPNPMQLKAHKSKADFVLFSGGNRSGKTTLGAVELAWHLTKEYPTWFPHERRFHGPIKAIVVATENAIIEKVLEPKIKTYLPRDFITHEKRITGHYLNRLTCKDGSTVDFLSNEQDDMAFESQDWDWYWGDEPQKERKFQGIMRGLVDRGGRGLMTFTPLIEPWMKEQLIDKADGKLIEAFIVDTRDNKFDIEGKPILTEDYIQRLESFMPEDLRDTRIHGKFFHLRGIVYQEFSEIHQIEFSYTYPDPVICVLDPHDRQPHHVIWAVLDKTDDVFIHSELRAQTNGNACTVQELAQKIKRIEREQGYRIKKRIIDPNFGRKPLITTGRNMMDELRLAGCGGWTEGIDAKDEGRLKVKEYLHYDREKKITEINKPKLFFHKGRVPSTIKSIRNYQYDEWVGKTNSEKDPKEKTKDKETHGADCVRYLCMSSPRSRGYDPEAFELAEAPY